MVFKRKRTHSAAKRPYRKRTAHKRSAYRKKTYRKRSLRGRGSYHRVSGLRGRGSYGGMHNTYGGFAGGNQLIRGSLQKPISVNAGNQEGDIFLSHREYVGPVTTNLGASSVSSFNLQTFSINAGLNATFAWLSQIAQNFDLYEFVGLVFEYRPTSGEFSGSSATIALGKVIMCTQYDPDQGAFSSDVQMENYDYATACKPSQGMLHAVETAPKQRATRMLYTRSGTSGKDKIFTDLGLFSIATANVPNGGAPITIGELWVSYKVKLSRAKLFTDVLGGNILADSSYFTPLIASFAPSTATNVTYKTTNTLGCIIAPVSRTDVSSIPFINGVTTYPVANCVAVVFPSTISGGCFRIAVATELGANNSTQYWDKIYTGLITGTPVVIQAAVAAGTTNATAWKTLGTTTLNNATPGTGVASTFRNTAGTAASATVCALFDINIVAPGNSQAIVVLGFSAVLSSDAGTGVTKICISQIPYSIDTASA